MEIFIGIQRWLYQDVGEGLGQVAGGDFRFVWIAMATAMLFGAIHALIGLAVAWAAFNRRHDEQIDGRALAVATGMIPCPLTTFVLTYALAKGVLASGLLVTAAMAFGMVITIPLISILTMIWLWRDTGDNERIAALSERAFWLVLPTLPMFLVLPALLRNGLSFPISIALACALTVGLYMSTAWVLSKSGIAL